MILYVTFKCSVCQGEYKAGRDGEIFRCPLCGEECPQKIVGVKIKEWEATF